MFPFLPAQLYYPQYAAAGRAQPITRSPQVVSPVSPAAIPSPVSPVQFVSPISSVVKVAQTPRALIPAHCVFDYDTAAAERPGQDKVDPRAVYVTKEQDIEFKNKLRADVVGDLRPRLEAVKRRLAADWERGNWPVSDYAYWSLAIADAEKKLSEDLREAEQGRILGKSLCTVGSHAEARSGGYDLIVKNVEQGYDAAAKTEAQRPKETAKRIDAECRRRNNNKQCLPHLLCARYGLLNKCQRRREKRPEEPPTERAEDQQYIENLLAKERADTAAAQAASRAKAAVELEAARAARAENMAKAKKKQELAAAATRG